MPRIIQDEFTALDISRQRKFQLRRERDGLCRLCSRKVRTKGEVYCRRHRIAQRCHCAGVPVPEDPQDFI